MILGTVIQVQQQARHLWKALAETSPEVGQAIQDEIARHNGRRQIQVQLVELRQIDPIGRHFQIRAEIVIQGFDVDATLAPAREGSHGHARLGIQAGAQDRFIRRRLLVEGG